jgi:hypothetical protein
MKTLSPTKKHVLVKTWIERNTDGAYEDLYNYLYEPVTKIVNIFIKNSAKTEDVTNDIFIRIYKLEEDVLPNTYHCYFAIDGKMYELSFSVKDDQIKDLTLSEWASVGDFENGDEPMFYYYKDEFREYFKMYL